MSTATTVAAVKSAIDAQFSTPRAVEIDQAAKQTSDYVLLFVSRRYMDGKLLSGEARVEGGRLITRYVARTVANAQAMRDRTRTALEEKFLPGGVGPFAFEAEHEPLDYDPDAGGWYTTADAWTY